MKKLLLFSILFLYQIYYSQSDCVSSIPVCGNSDISYTPSGPGNTQDIPNPAPADLCLKGGEHFSVWYSFTIATSGTLTFTINPNVFTDDYDFAVYGPNVPCSSIFTTTPIRCNYSGADGPTGLVTTLTGTATSGAFSAYMDVVAGQTYYLLVDNFLSSANGFSMSWGGTATLTSAFNNPVLTPHPFITPGVPNV
ncbi:MAG: chromophore lyase, partial [Chryseobacterium sp.]